jgi:hypothetical protein
MIKSYISFNFFFHMYNIFNLITISCDYPRPWGMYFQDTASAHMEALIKLYDNITSLGPLLCVIVTTLLICFLADNSEVAKQADTSQVPKRELIPKQLPNEDNKIYSNLVWVRIPVGEVRDIHGNVITLSIPGIFVFDDRSTPGLIPTTVLSRRARFKVMDY